MYGIFAYIYHKNQTNVGKYTIHGWFMIYLYISTLLGTNISAPQGMFESMKIPFPKVGLKFFFLKLVGIP